MNQQEDEGAEYGLVMPFVVVESAGGPYDDAAFVAGWECGAIEAALERLSDSRTGGVLAPFWMANIHSPNAPQVDLIAMRFGFEIESEPVKGMEDEWTAVTFRFGPVIA